MIDDDYGVTDDGDGDRSGGFLLLVILWVCCVCVCGNSNNNAEYACTSGCHYIATATKRKGIVGVCV